VPEILDSLDMFGAAAGLPDQIQAAMDDFGPGPLPDRDDIDNVVVLGMGGSGVAGDVIRAVAGPLCPVPIVVAKGYEPPHFVGDRTLVFAVSFSGDTEETIEATTTAATAGARVVAVAHGGRLSELAGEWSAPWHRLADGIPQPRAGLGALVTPIALTLEDLGLYPGAREFMSRGVEQLRRRVTALTKPDNAAADLARRLGRTLPIVYGGGELGGVAAARWKTEVNENARVAAFANTSPELCHNEIAGWGQHGDMTRQVFSLVNLRHDFEHPQVMRRFDLVEEVAVEVTHRVETVAAEGAGMVAQLFDLMMVGTFTSLHLATQEGIDPGPVPALDWVKSTLKS
jgi:glucose/mannose-6-phosphate isomerase